MGIGDGAEQSATETRGLRKIIHIDMDAFYASMSNSAIILSPASR